MNAATANMPGSSSRLWSSLPYRSLLLNAVNKVHEAFLSGARPCKGVVVASLADNPPVATFDVIKFFHSAGVKTLSSSLAWRGGSERGEWGSQIISLPCLLSQSKSCRGFCYPNSSTVTSVSLFHHRHSVSSIAYAAKHPRREQQERKANTRAGSQLKSRKRGVVARKGRPAFGGALSSIKHLQTEKVRGISKASPVRGDARKKHVMSPGLSSRKPGLVIRSTLRKNSSLSAGIKLKDRPADQNQNLGRKRKRIKPRPRDITYKRGLDSDIVNAASDVGLPPTTQEKMPSLNAQFRQIQPSRELLAFIEENLLGRRRLSEWRRGGYDPKRTAPLDDLPEGKANRNPIQETVFKHKLTFIAAAKQAPSLPPLEYPEVAFAGRSNVGKSSLINALTRRWGAARTSEKPGLTQSINFFMLGSQLCLVDLPGYGFAYAKEEKKEEWEELVKDYVQTRANLKRVCVLVDAKWGLKPRDEELLHLMESAGTRYQVVITKTDVLPPVDLARRATQILELLEDHRCFIQPLVMVSSKTGAGLQLFRASLARIALSQARVLQEDRSQTNFEITKALV